MPRVKTTVDPKYSPNCRIGNWNEELLLEEERLKLYMRKRERGDLQIQKVRKMFGRVLKEIKVQVPLSGLCYGHLIQIIAEDVKPKTFTRHGKKVEIGTVNGLALSICVTEHEINSGGEIIEGCSVTGSPNLMTCVRNVFKICSPKEEPIDDGEPLKYGKCFCLSTADSRDSEPLFLDCENPTMSSILGESKHPLVRLSKHCGRFSRWLAIPADQIARQESSSANFVMPNARVILRHASTNQNLAIETNFWFSTYFGMECEIAVANYFDIYRRETNQNIWTLTTKLQDSDKKENIRNSENI